MDIDSATPDVKDEQVEETDDSCIFEYFEIVPLARDTDGTCTTECATGNWSAEVKQENLAVVKQEPDDVCCVLILYLVCHNRNDVFKSFLVQQIVKSCF